MIKRFAKSSDSTQDTLFNAAVAKDENIIGKKITEERKARKLSLDDLSALLEKHGVPVLRGAISKWELGNTTPNGYQLLALCEIFGIDDFLSFFSGKQELNYEGRRKVTEYKSDLIATGKYSPTPVIPKITYIQMPISYMAASAGTGNFLDDENFEMQSVPQNAVPAGADFGIRVAGDSMEPVYTNGQIVWVKECSALNPGEVGIFMLNGEGYIKMFSDQEPNNVEDFTDSTGVVHKQPVLVSYNSNYAPIVVSENDRLQIVGKVL